ncbi:type VI secretion system baseplate subunit TssF, partial [Pandoraea terrae]|uniref:type VI secretion system baseplate subunit TssF n=1 Tax=Pandoraea terrae TaxID=1537710 RepID=UPI00124239EF
MSGPRHGPNRPPVLREFEAEMRYLREAAKEFAQSHPQAAARLGLTRFGGRGDAVEQLFQGFAFLSARMGGKLADELPELTEPLTGMLWPHTVRTIPSLTILELLPHAERPAGQVLPAGLTVRSTPVGDAQTVCTYRTTQFVNVLPLTLRDAAQQLRPDGRSAIRLAFEVRRFDRRSPGVLSRIRLYLHGDRIVASTLYAALTRDAYAIEVRMPSFHDGRAQPQPKMTLQAAGFGPATRLWPQDERKPGESL